MIKGVTPKELSEIQKILQPYMREYQFFLYGSRVKGTHTPVSDLDILIKGKKEMPISEKSNIKALFDNSHIPYVVNFTDYKAIDEKFYNLIKKDLLTINLD